MAPFEFSAHPTPEQLRLALNTFFRGQYRLFRVVGLLIIVLSVVPILVGDHFSGLFGMLLGLGFVTVVPPLNTRLILRKIRSSLERPTLYRIDDQGICMSNDQTEQLFRWPAVSRVEQAEGLLIGRHGKTWVLVVPTAGLPLATASELTSFVLARVPAQS